MKKEEFCEILSDVNENYVKEARTVKKPNWHKWGVLAACLCLAVAVVFLYPKKEPNCSHDFPAEAVGFMMNGQRYYPITFDERKEFNLVPADDIGLTKENTYQITKKDLGAPMGVIEDSPAEELIGLSVYYFASHPNDERICIVDAGEVYAFYVRE